MKDRLTFFPIVFLFLGSLASVYGQGIRAAAEYPDKPSRFVDRMWEQQILTDSLWLWQEHVNLHVDKDVFYPEDLLFFMANILTGPDQLRVSASEVLRIELLDQRGALISHQVHKIEKGRTHGSLKIPKKIEPGLYYLRAYTRWMLNYGPEFLSTREIVVKDRKDGPPLLRPEELAQVVPEGGVLVDGLTTRVVVSSPTLDLDLIPVVNQKGEEVTRIKGYGKGLGTFRLNPLKGERYAVRIAENQLIQLPEVLETGYSLQVNNLQKDKILIRIEAEEVMRKSPAYLVGESDGFTYFDQAVEFDAKGSAQIEIPKAELPEGIFTIRLKDPSGRFWAYRPVNIAKNELQLRAQKLPNPNGSQTLKIRVTDRDGKPVETSLSVSLTAEALAIDQDGRTGLDLSLTDVERNTIFLDDLKVLAGRGYLSTEVVKRSSVPEQIRYSFQKGLDFYGQAYNLNNELLNETDIQILIEDGDEAYVREVRTDSDGRFQITGLDITAEATLVFRTSGDETKAKLVKVIPYEYEIPPLRIPLRRDLGLSPAQGSDLAASRDFRSSQPLEQNDTEAIKLKTVTLVATRDLKRSTVPEYALQPTRVIKQDRERLKPIDELFLNIPGVQVVGLGTPYPSLSIPRAAGAGPLLWVIDGLPLDQSTRLIDVISLVPYTDVDRIEILTGAEAAIYGTRAAGGVISITTRTGSEMDYLVREDAQAQLKGYHPSVSFTPAETESRDRRKRNRPVHTLFWDPELKTDKNGEVSLGLPATVQADQIRLEARVFTETGKRGNIEIFFDKKD